MIFDVLVILNPPVANLRDKVREQMRPFDHNDWDYEDSGRRARWGRPRWDWYRLNDDGPFADAEAHNLVSGFDAPSRVCRMSHLPEDYWVVAAITPDGAWHDLDDSGRVIDDHSPQTFRDIVVQHQDAIGVEVHCHG